MMKLTLQNKAYKKLCSEISLAMANVNAKATDMTNEFVDNIYMLNYNEVAEDCKKVGIRVNG